MELNEDLQNQAQTIMIRELVKYHGGVMDDYTVNKPCEFQGYQGKIHLARYFIDFDPLVPPVVEIWQVYPKLSSFDEGTILGFIGNCWIYKQYFVQRQGKIRINSWNRLVLLNSFENVQAVLNSFEDLRRIFLSIQRFHPQIPPTFSARPGEPGLPFPENPHLPPPPQLGARNYYYLWLFDPLNPDLHTMYFLYEESEDIIRDKLKAAWAYLDLQDFIERYQRVKG